MWEPRRLTTLWGSMACYRDSFAIIIIIVHVIITKTVKKIFKFLKILSSLQCKILYYLSRIVGGAYQPELAVMFLYVYGTVRV
jgi:hypothetical protein